MVVVGIYVVGICGVVSWLLYVFVSLVLLVFVLLVFVVDCVVGICGC